MSKVTPIKGVLSKEALWYIAQYFHGPSGSAIINYYEHGIAPGSFLRAILTNNFEDALLTADSENLQLLHKWAIFLRYHAPSGGHGSLDAYKDYLAKSKERVYG